MAKGLANKIYPLLKLHNLYICLLKEAACYAVNNGL